MTFYSQCGQDEFLEKMIFCGFKDGFFMDIGAHDGVTINNTLYFERNNNWTGVNVEPLKDVYDLLCKNRPNCINLQCAVCNKNGSAEFICNTGYTEMISGLKDNYDYRHFYRLNRELTERGGSTNIVLVNTKKIETICEENNITHIHYLSIDVEGAEFDVIKSINFDKVFIDVIGFENNYDDTSIPIVNYLQERGYSVIKNYTDIIMIHNKSRFC
jgi:FkbM family methyltransferase